MSKVIIIVIVLVVLGFAAWMLMGNGALPYTMPNQSGSEQGQSQASGAKEIEVPLNTQNSSNELGAAIIQEVNGKLVVKVNLKGEPEGASQPAHIHLGACPNPGVVKYPLTSVVNGSSETTLDTTKDELMKLGPIAVNVHKSDADMKTYVACGDVKF